MTIDDARRLAESELREADFRSRRDFTAALNARADLCHALGEALSPDPPMRVVQEAIRLAEEYRATITAIARKPANRSPSIQVGDEAVPSVVCAAERRNPVEMTPVEAAVMLSWCRPTAHRVPSPPPAASANDLAFEETPEGTLDLLWDLGHAIGSFLGRVARGLGGGG